MQWVHHNYEKKKKLVLAFKNSFAKLESFLLDLAFWTVVRKIFSDGFASRDIIFHRAGIVLDRFFHWTLSLRWRAQNSFSTSPADMINQEKQYKNNAKTAHNQPSKLKQEQIATERSASKSWSWFSSISASLHHCISSISTWAASVRHQHHCCKWHIAGPNLPRTV